MAIAQVEVLAVRGVWGPGGADAFFGKGGEGVAECRAGQDAWQGAEAFGLGSSGGCLGQRTQHWT